MPVYIRVAWSVKFRAAGITFGSYGDHKSVQLPPIFKLAEKMVHTPYNYNDHGIQVSVTLSDTP